MADVIDFKARAAQTEGEDEGAQEQMVEFLEGLLLRAKAGELQSVGVAVVFADSSFFTFSAHINKKSTELGTAIIALQHDYIASFSHIEPRPLPTQGETILFPQVKGNKVVKKSKAQQARSKKGSSSAHQQSQRKDARTDDPFEKKS